jgi:hypothetical protein
MNYKKYHDYNTAYILMKSKNNIYLFIALFRGGIVKGQSLLYKYKDSIWLFIHGMLIIKQAP